MRIPVRWLSASLLLAVVGCGPKTIYTDTDVPALPKLGDVMWAQAQAVDPQFKKIGAATYGDADYAGFLTAAARLKLTSARLQQDFSRGAEWNQFAIQLATNATDLDAAATAKDAAKSSSALAATKATCKACHAKLR